MLGHGNKIKYVDSASLERFARVNARVLRRPATLSMGEADTRLRYALNNIISGATVIRQSPEYRGICLALSKVSCPCKLDSCPDPTRTEA